MRRSSPKPSKFDRLDPQDYTEGPGGLRFEFNEEPVLSKEHARRLGRAIMSIVAGSVVAFNVFAVQNAGAANEMPRSNASYNLDNRRFVGPPSNPDKEKPPALGPKLAPTPSASSSGLETITRFAIPNLNKPPQVSEPEVPAQEITDNTLPKPEVISPPKDTAEKKIFLVIRPGTNLLRESEELLSKAGKQNATPTEIESVKNTLSKTNNLLNPDEINAGDQLIANEAVKKAEEIAKQKD